LSLKVDETDYELIKILRS